MKTKSKTATLLLIAITLASAFLIFDLPTAKANTVEDAITAGLDWLDRMAYLQINDTHAVALESPSLSFRIHRSDGYWTIFGKKDNLNLPPSASMIRGGCLNPQQTTDDLGLITGAIDRQRMKYFFDIDGDGDYNDVVLYVEYATMTDTNTRVSGKVVGYVNKGLTLSLQLETTQVLATVSLNAQFSIDKAGGWAGRRYTIRPTTKGLADLYVWLGTTQFSWLGGQTYQQTRGVNYLDRALKLYRTWYGSGYIIDRFDGMYGATLNVRPWAGTNGIPNYAPNPDLILEPNLLDPLEPDYSTYYVGSPTSHWYSYTNHTTPQYDEVLRSPAVSRHMMPDGEHWNNCPFQCSDTQFCFAYRSRTGFEWARNQYIANGFEYDLTTFNNRLGNLPGIDVVLGIGTDAKSIRACADMAKYGANIPYGNGLSTLREEFIDSAQWDGNGIARDSWHGSPIGWPYPGYGAHNTATYANALVQYYKLTSDAAYGAKVDQVIGVLLMLQNRIGVPVYSRAETASYYRAEFLGSFLPGYSVAYSFGQIDVYSAEWLDLIYGTVQFFGVFQVDPASACFPCLGNAECTIPSVWALIQYRTTNRTPMSPNETAYTLSFRDDVVAYTDHGGSYGGDGNTEIISSNVQSQYIGGGTGNVYRHTGYINRIRMYAASGAFSGDAWSSIEYEWPFTLTQTAPNWRAKAYFTIPDWYGWRIAGENSLAVTVSLYDSGGSLITQDSRTSLENLHGGTGQSGTGGKMFVYNDMAKLDSLTAGTYTVKLKFRVHSSGGTWTGLYLGYIEDTPNIDRALPMGLEYFGYDVGWNDNFDDNTRDTTKWDTLAFNGGSVAEANSQLQVSIPSGGSGQAGAGYVTTNMQNINGFTATININEHNSIGEMTLQICTTKVTGSDPFWQSNWYRIDKYLTNQNTYIQRKISGTQVTLSQTSWASATGQMKISVANGNISLYENGALKWTEPYQLPIYNVYIYVFTSSARPSDGSGTDSFDDFGFSPTISVYTEPPAEGIEDFTTYTQIDPNSHIDLVGTNHIDNTVRRNEDACIYKDKGAGYFTNFQHKIDVKISSAAADGSYSSMWTLTNDIDDSYSLWNNHKTALDILFYRIGAVRYLYLCELYDRVNYCQNYAVSTNTWYYLTITKAGTAFTCSVYSDAARTNLLTTLSLTLHGNWSFRYIFATNSYNDGTTYQMDCDVENLRLG